MEEERERTEHVTEFAREGEGPGGGWHQTLGVIDCEREAYQKNAGNEIMFLKTETGVERKRRNRSDPYDTKCTSRPTDKCNSVLPM